jgi:hypothetical protein
MEEDDDRFTFQKILLDFYDGDKIFERKPTTELLLYITSIMMMKTPILDIFRSTNNRKVLGA